jgi:hypothetical protein
MFAVELLVPVRPAAVAGRQQRVPHGRRYRGQHAGDFKQARRRLPRFIVKTEQHARQDMPDGPRCHDATVRPPTGAALAELTPDRAGRGTVVMLLVDIMRYGFLI